MVSSAAAVRVLHIDDDPEFAELTADFLRREDSRLEVITETGPHAGIERLRVGDIDCVVSDYEMPEMNGVELLETVHEEYPDLPFILFTGKGSEEVASDAISAGATDYLQKESGTDQYTLLANRVLNYVETSRAQRQQKRQLNAIETAREGIAILDSDGRFVSVNEAYADLYGYESESLLGDDWRLTGADSGDPTRDEVLAAVEAAGDWRGRTTGQRSDGTTFREDHSLSRTDAGGFVCTVRDISDREQRKRSLQRYETIIEALGDPVYAVDRNGNYSFVNEAYTELMGYSRSEILGQPISFLLDGPSVERGTDAVRSLLSSGTDETQRTYEITIETKDGKRIRFEDNVSLLPLADGQYRGVAGVIRDMTDRNARERDRRRHEGIVNAMEHAACVYDEDGRIKLANERLGELYGRSPTDLEGEACRLVEEIRTSADGDPYRELIAGDRETLTGECELYFPAAGERVIEYWLSRLVIDGEFDGIVAIARDVTDRKARERELERYETIVETIPDEVYMLDADGYLQLVIPPTGSERATTGYRPGELVGEHVSTVMADEDVETGNEVIRQIVESDDDHRNSFEMELVQKDGERSLVENHIGILSNDGEFHGTVGVLRDISERKARERELRWQNERLEQFAGIVSHDLQTPLNVAQGRLRLAREAIDSGQPDSDLAATEDALKRMRTLIDETLMLAKQGEAVGELQTVDLSALSETCWRTVETGDGTLGVEGAPSIRADPSRLRNLLENLFQNAVEHGSTSPDSQARQDSVEHGSTNSRPQTDDAVEHGSNTTVSIGPLDDGFYVEDDGLGIPPADREVVFEPGHTTTEGGTGFGLAIVEEIAEAHGWDIIVTDGENGGARFEITGVDFA